MASEKVKLIFEMCRRYLGPPWQEAAENDIKIGRLVSGLSGLVFRCHLNVEISPKSHVSRDVICRLNDFCTLAQKVLAYVNDGNEGRTTETVVFTVLGERGLGPKLVAIFPGGRFEEFIEGRELTFEEDVTEEVQAAIAAKLAALHAVDMPVDKTVAQFNTFMNSSLEVLLQESKTATILERDRAVANEVFSNFDFKKELNWINLEIGRLGPQPIVFCHRDIRRSNVLLKPPNYLSTTELPLKDRLVLIDIEFAGYTYRGVDLASYLGRIMYRFGTDRWPHFTFDLDDLPDEHAQRAFVRAYISEMSKFKGPDFSRDPVNSEERIFLELQFNYLTMFYFLLLIVLGNALKKGDDTDFGHWEGVLSIVKVYRHFKNNWRQLPDF